jgi:hypothetical protein
MKTRQCYWCTNTAEGVDYRNLDGVVNKIPTCRVCFGLPTEYCRKKRNKVAEKTGDTFHIKVSGQPFEFTPEETDWWTGTEEFDVHYCEEYSEISVYPVKNNKVNWDMVIESYKIKPEDFLRDDIESKTQEQSKTTHYDISIPLSERDLQGLMDGEEFNWNFITEKDKNIIINTHLHNKEED